MHPLSIGLILLSAVAHVYWNYQIKRSPAPAIFTWWLLVIGALLFLPLALSFARPLAIPPAGWYCVGGTALFYGGYFAAIALSYRREDFSRAYPIARGVAPAATAVWGVLFHQEHPSPIGWAGIVAISLGVFVLAGSSARRRRSLDEKPTRSSHPGSRGALPLAGIMAAVATGLCTSGYSAVDKEGVKHVPPVLYIVLTFIAGALVQSVWLLPRWGWRAFVAEARRGGIRLWSAGVLSLGGYLLVLTVLRTEPVSYVVPLRSVSVLLSVLVGRHLLGEGGDPLRLGAAAAILAGITAIALGG